MVLYFCNYKQGIVPQPLEGGGFMTKRFGGLTIVRPQQMIEGAVIELDNTAEKLYVKQYEKKRNYYGEVYGFKEIDSYEIGKALEYFYDENEKLRDPNEIISRIVHTIIYEIGFYPDKNDFLVDESVTLYYTECKK